MVTSGRFLPRPMSAARILVGLALVAVGVGLALDVLGVVPFAAGFGTWWPLLLVAGGFLLVLSHPRRPVMGLVLILVGALLQLDRLSRLPAHWSNLIWPAVLVMLGLAILLRAVVRRRRWEARWAERQARWDARAARRGARRGETDAPSGPDTTDISAFFAGIEEAPKSQAWRGGRVEAAFGGCKLDLRGAMLAAEGATLVIRATFAGVEVWVPSTWRVDVHPNPVGGGVKDDTSHAANDGPTLEVHANAAFGGVRIRN